MGKSRTPPYRIVYFDQAGKHVCCWEERVRRPYFGQGKPTNAKAEDWRVAMNKSFQPDGSNQHIRLVGNGIPHINRVYIVHQLSGAVVATAVMPMFEVM